MHVLNIAGASDAARTVTLRAGRRQGRASCPQLDTTPHRAAEKSFTRFANCRVATSRTHVTAVSDDGDARCLWINVKSLGDFRQRQSRLVKGNRSTTTIVIQARRSETTSSTQNQSRDRSTMHPMLRSDRLHWHPHLVVGDQRSTPLRGQSCLRLHRILRDCTSRVLSIRGSVPRSASLRVLENAANQRLQRRAAV